MHIVVCVTLVEDPETPHDLLRVDEATKTAVRIGSGSQVMNPFDEQALEAALRIRDATSQPESVSISALTLCDGSDKAIKHALAMGADAAVMIVDPIFRQCDYHATAAGLAAAVRKLGNVDLVLTGRQMTDSDAGIVGAGLAELLKIPVITLARKIKVADSEVTVCRAIGEGEETMQATLPALITIAHELGAVRKPSLRETMRAGKKPITRLTKSDLNIPVEVFDPSSSHASVMELCKPLIESNCQWIAGESSADKAKALVDHLIAERIL
ncbi:electron transfer flavoprotein subunit beta/FixA family protein [Pseudorhodoplanes sp.]|uniref:electron transfer flavoprotein subunit beta/FixA family protein n=1 Tax=Pseudorhodoplanes sp. TaxID=1934341 RepID=UPI003D0D5F3C